MSRVSSREEVLFTAALALPAEERSAFVEDACRGEPALREGIFALLKAHQGPGSLMGAFSPVAVLRDDLSAVALKAEEKPGDMIDRYKLLQKIGEGGCGVVWMAEQEEPVRRQVALKVIKLGMDTKIVVARFEAERQALARMDHPGIARVFDAGCTGTGRPFFVMELVRGIPITRYCDDNQLTPGARLELFVDVCHAVQHAHQKGVIHRDLKPSNILVTAGDGQPAPKIIDFGIAKATQGRLADTTLFTAFEQFIGTPAYMSPEQAEMSSLDIDTRTDIYSLGVLLYELLTGRPPFDPGLFEHAGVDGIRRMIREIEAPRPSARWRTLGEDERTALARLRSTAAAQLAVVLRGDLEWIVMRCIEKDRTRRYETANELAMDIRRYVRHEPVIARPPSTPYLLQKFIRRHCIGFAASVAVFLVTLLAAIVSTSLAVRAIRAERSAERARAIEAGAEASEHAASRRTYAADMNLVQQALAVDNLGRARELLAQQVPSGGRRDLRGWEWRYLWQASRGEPHERLEVMPHDNWALAFSSDGSWLAAADLKGTVSVWSLPLRQPFRLPGGVSAVRLAFSPIEPLLAISGREDAGSTRETIELWNVTTRRRERRFEVDGRCVGMFFSSDGGTLLSANSGRGITRWRLGGDGSTSIVPAPVSPTYAGYAFAATGDLRLGALSATDHSMLALVDLGTGRERWTAPAAEELVAAIAFSPDGTLLATGACYVETGIRLWDVETGAEIGRLHGHRSWVSALVFWPDGRTLASAGADQTIRLWDVPRRRLLRTLRGHQAEVYRLALHPDNATLASGGKDGTVCLWDTREARNPYFVHILPERVAAWRLIDLETVVTLSPSGDLARWSGPEFQDRRLVMRIDAAGVRDRSFERGNDALLYTAHFAAGQPLLAVGSATGAVEVWDYERGVRSAAFAASAGPVLPVAFVHGGRRLVVYASTEPAMYHEWDLATGGAVAAWAAPERAWGPSLAIAPDESHALAVGFDGKSVSRHLASGNTRRFELPVTKAEGPGFSPDGRLVALPSHLGVAKLWRLPEWEEVATLSGFTLGVHSVVFTPDGSRLATGSNGSEAIKLWDVESRLALLTLDGRGSRFSRSEFSADGSVLGSITRLGQLHLWRVPSWEEIDRAEKSAATAQAR
jgi:eukaryotic-like serine/threonine-protein kinase